ncbi:MAG: hypothetical protein ACYDCL_23055 [Myxococcales bacterium]
MALVVTHACLLAALAAGPAHPLRLAFQSSYFVDAPGAAGGTGAKAGGDDMNFELLPEAPKASTAEQKKIAAAFRTRRTMLLLHQGFGIATVLGMVGTVIFGQLNYSDKFAGAPQTGQWEIWHDWFEAGTVLTFATAGLLALLAPVPIEKKNEGIDTVTLHKYSMLVATVGMAAEVVLGILTVSREGFTDQATLATAHLVIGYATAGALATGVTVLFF